MGFHNTDSNEIGSPGFRIGWTLANFQEFGTFKEEANGLARGSAS
jgi:hypothetical protein